MVYGRWVSQALELVPALVAARARGLPRRVRGGATNALSRRWWSLLGVATQRLVTRAVLRNSGADLVTTLLEEPPARADLPA